MTIEARDLQSALIEASKNLECSVIDLEYEILQNSKAGFLGFGRKNAIIKASIKKRIQSSRAFKKDHTTNKYSSKTIQGVKKEIEREDIFQKKQSYSIKSDTIFDNFYRENLANSDILDEIRLKLENLLQNSSFQISVVELKMYNENCVFIHLDGKDAALMIGKQAHRYKAISYLLYNWINLRYKLNVRLEIAEFLKNQNQALQQYIEHLSRKIRMYGRCQTKPLDSVLIKLTLEQLRAEFPNKFVSIRQNGEQRFIVVNDFHKKDE
ncbi:Jag N-terminal domain-containing protein [Campylobacter sp. MIT 21-1685]|uniref:Jag N-terminal domain-containing protein n=1 Tax=unclassified Campylobacter TaxID=2593542 RepID=UPI00224B056F|nr:MULTISPECIES: Jag N-terminal domain-containing protein [unclassified Campylobacter]MCX2683094.1 Jag N-terminal domain-containing protein [Campylobacter sp. MIT 21-1684]MCX2751446.1 Jag N-terminal domain-containing protein [Campylobacter sp. MIT 21-1682]MCX2807646.1 Jag N-terminal domain-containing protein [Campylobacter sp. MIT 21-1685]